MKRTIAAAALGAALFPAAAFAQEAAYTTSELNMRAGPGPDYPVVSVLGESDGVTIHACLEGRSWCDVSGDAGRGWVSGDYLAFQSDGTTVLQSSAEVPVTVYEPGPYFDQYYRDRDFYAQRDQYVTTATRTQNGSGGALTGAAGGAAVGAVVGGPIGAAVGGIAGAAVGSIAEPPGEVRTYVTQHRVEPVPMQTVEIGAAVPASVTLHRVPDYDYEYTYVNGQPVLVDPATRQIVYVYR